MEYDVLAVLPGYNEREELDRSAEQLLTAFMETHPETGPVASVDLVHDTFDIAFTVEADDALDAVETAKSVFNRAANASLIMPRKVTGFHIDVADAVPA